MFEVWGLPPYIIMITNLLPSKNSLAPANAPRHNNVNYRYNSNKQSSQDQPREGPPPPQPRKQTSPYIRTHGNKEERPLGLQPRHLRPFEHLVVGAVSLRSGVSF